MPDIYFHQHLFLQPLKNESLETLRSHDIAPAVFLQQEQGL